MRFPSTMFTLQTSIKISGHNLESSQIEVSVDNVKITNKYQTTFAWVIAKRKTLKTFVPITSKNLASVLLSKMSAIFLRAYSTRLVIFQRF